MDWFHSERTLCRNSLLPPSLAPLHLLPSVAQSLLQLTAKGNRKFSPGWWEGTSPSRGSLSASLQFWPIFALFGATPATLPHFPAPPQQGHGNTVSLTELFVAPQAPGEHQSFLIYIKQLQPWLICALSLWRGSWWRGDSCVLRHCRVPNVQALAQPASGEIAKCKMCPGNFPAVWERWASPTSSPTSHLQGFAGCSLVSTKCPSDLCPPGERSCVN